MDKTLQKIHQILEKLIEQHRKLLETVKAEREALIHAEVPVIQSISTAKQKVIESIQLVEAERLKTVEELASFWKVSPSEVSITFLVGQIEKTNPKKAEQFRSTYQALLLLVQQVTEQNQQNRALIEESLEHILQMKKNILGESVPKSNTYTQQGQRASYPQGSRLISQEA